MCGCVYVWVLQCVGVCMCGFCNVVVCMCGFCDVWVCAFVGFEVCGIFDNCVGVMVMCVLVFTVFLYCFLST